MPSYIGPNTSGEENLVFAYDLGNRDNSYKNPPAINLVHSNVARGSTSNWDGYGVHTGFGLINHGTVEKDGRPDTVAVTWTDQGSGTQTGDWYPRFYLRNPDGSLITTTGGEVFYAAWEYKYEGEEYLTSGGADYDTENFYGNGWKSGVHGSIDRLYIEELPLGWKRRVARIVAGDSGTVQTPMYRFGSGYKRANGGDFTLWLDNITITRDYPVHSWFPGQSEITPSESLLDLTGNSTIDLTNVSFDSNAQITFDGTDDFINTGINSSKWAAETFTIEGWVKYDNINGDDGWFELQRNGSEFGLSTVVRTNRFYFYWIGHGSNVGYNVGSNAFVSNSWIHITITHQGTDSTNYQDVFANSKVYVNGEHVPHSSGGSAGVSNGGNLLVGSQQYYFAGDIPYFKYYNRVLNADEIADNYNSTKSRYL